MESFHVGMLGLMLLALLSPWLRLRAREAGSASEDTGSEPVRPTYRTLSDHMGRGDNFLLLRLVAASVVIYAHSYALSPLPSEGDHLSRILGIYSGNVAVYVFFMISGFLVTGSWLRQRSLRGFLVSRVLRIVPAYAVCLLVCALAIGTVVSHRPAAEYLTDPLTWRFIYWNLSFPELMQFTLPGVFEQRTHQAINGSLWTLPAEVPAYALLAIFGLLGLLNRLPRLLLALIAAFWLVVFEAHRVPMVAVPQSLPMLGYFALGAAAWTARRALPLDGRVVVALLLLTIASRGASVYPYAFAITLSYACLWFAYLPRTLLFFNRYGDYSYGVYLWGYPMQQLTVTWLHDPTPTLISLLAWPMALGCAVFSWHLIEKPAMSFRPRPKAAASDVRTSHGVI